MKVSRLADKTDEILPKVLEAGAEIVEDKVRSNLQAVIGSGTKYDSRSTGELLRSLGTSPALQDRDGHTSGAPVVPPGARLGSYVWNG